MNKIIIPKAVYDKVMHWVNKSSNEVGGFGTVKYEAETKSFRVVEAYLLKQEVGMAHTDLDAKAIGKLMYDTRNDDGDLRWWWHSHVQMPVFWSGTDVSTIKDLGKHEWAVATVFNQKEETRSALCYKAATAFDADNLVLEDDIDTEIEWPEITYAEAVVAQWDKDFTDNVEVKTYLPPTYLAGPHGVPNAYAAWGDDTAWGRHKPVDRTTEHRRSSYMAHPSLIDIDDDDDDDFYYGMAEEYNMAPQEDLGMFGYGIISEALVLGMNPRKYRKLLSKESIAGNKLKEMEDKLLHAIETGILT